LQAERASVANGERTTIPVACESLGRRWQRWPPPLCGATSSVTLLVTLIQGLRDVRELRGFVTNRPSK
jgi:hypothetical protein